LTPNYTRAVNRSVEVLKKYGINKAPIDLKGIIDQIPDLKVCAYSEFSAITKCSINEIIEFLGSELGAIARDPKSKKYVIYYNDMKYNRGLDRFTVSHELGHYFLNHHNLITNDVLNRDGFMPKEYDVMENEANCFARNLLSPVPLYNRIIQDPMTLGWRVMEAFNISFEASNARIKFLPLDTYRITKNHIEYFADYEMPYFDYCDKCKSPITTKVNCCPICGSKDIKNIWDNTINVDCFQKTMTMEELKELQNPWNTKLFKRSEKMFYEGIEVDKQSKAVRCPVCDNEEVDDGEHCKICGTYIINKCTNGDYPDRNEYDDDICGKLLEGNARYCPYCGAKSTFFENGLLKSWDKSIHDDRDSSNDLFDFDDNIFQPVEDDEDDDEDIPF